MLSIARALLTNPTVLLMDEPTEGLAPILVEALTAVLAKLQTQSGLSIILVEQNSRVALTFSPLPQSFALVNMSARAIMRNAALSSGGS